MTDPGGGGGSAAPDANESAYDDEAVVGAATGFDPLEIEYDFGRGGPIS